RNRYSYTDNRRLVRADRMYSNVRGNSLERQKPNRSFVSRNENVTNRRALETSRGTSRSNTLQTTDRVRTTVTRNVAMQYSRINTSNRTSNINSGRQRDRKRVV